MTIVIRFSSEDAQFIFVRKGDEVGYTIEISDVEIQELPKWALEELYKRIGEELSWEPPK
jgi:hypothetical protein